MSNSSAQFGKSTRPICCFHIVLFFLPIVGITLSTVHLVVFGVTSSVSTSKFKEVFKEIKFVLNQKPFDQITVIDSQSSCASDLSPVVFSIYPGTEGSESMYSNELQYETKSQHLHNWENKKLCSKLSKYTYYDLLLKFTQPSSGMCPDNTKLCGYLDKLNQLLCMPINEPCPINYLTLTSTNEVPKDYNQKDISKLTSVELGSNKYLHYSNGIEDGYSLINITASQGDICIVRNKFIELYPEYARGYLESRTPDKKEELRCLLKNDKEIISDSFTKLDTVSYYQYYTWNEIDSLIDELPNYPVTSTSSHKISLFKGILQGINHSCVKNSMPITIERVDFNIKWHEGLWYIIICVFSLYCSSYAFIFFHCFCLCPKHPKHFERYMILTIVFIGLGLAGYIFGITIFTMMKFDPACFYGEMFHLINIYNEELVRSIALFCFNSFILIIPLVSYFTCRKVYIYRFGDKPRTVVVETPENANFKQDAIPLQIGYVPVDIHKHIDTNLLEKETTPFIFEALDDPNTQQQQDVTADKTQSYSDLITKYAKSDNGTVVDNSKVELPKVVDKLELWIINKNLHKEEITAFHFVGVNGLYTGTKDGTVSFWGLDFVKRAWKCGQVQEKMHDSAIKAILQSVNFIYLLTLAEEPIVKAWEFTKKGFKLYRIVELHNKEILTLEIVNEFRVASAGRDGIIQLWTANRPFDLRHTLKVGVKNIQNADELPVTLVNVGKKEEHPLDNNNNDINNNENNNNDNNNDNLDSQNNLNRETNNDGNPQIVNNDITNDDNTYTIYSILQLHQSRTIVASCKSSKNSMLELWDSNLGVYKGRINSIYTTHRKGMVELASKMVAVSGDRRVHVVDPNKYVILGEFTQDGMGDILNAGGLVWLDLYSILYFNDTNLMQIFALDHSVMFNGETYGLNKGSCFAQSGNHLIFANKFKGITVYKMIYKDKSEFVTLVEANPQTGGDIAKYQSEKPEN